MAAFVLCALRCIPSSSCRPMAVVCGCWPEQPSSSGRTHPCGCGWPYTLGPPRSAGEIMARSAELISLDANRLDVRLTNGQVTYETLCGLTTTNEQQDGVERCVE